MVRWPKSGWCAVACSVPYKLDVLDRNGAAGEHEIDPDAQCRDRIEQIGGLTAGESRKRGIPLLPSIGEAGADEHLISGKCGIGAVVARIYVEITSKHMHSSPIIGISILGTSLTER